MSEWMITSAQAIGGLLLLYYGGEWLVKGAAALAARLGVSPLAIGLTVVAFGTSAPELMVSLQAALAGAPDIAIGNVVGSNIANIGLILGTAALIKSLDVHANIIRIDTPIMIGVLGLMLVALSNDLVSRVEGLALAAGLIGYLVMTLILSRRETAATQAEFAADPRQHEGSLSSNVTLVLVGVVGLVGGGKLLVTSAVTIASSLGVSQAVIGLTIVAVGTSLPELAAAIVASMRNHGDIAVGNVIGSNIFNTLGILGITGAVSPLPRGDMDWISLGVMMCFALALWPLASWNRRVLRWEGACLLAGYFAYIGWLAINA